MLAEAFAALLQQQPAVALALVACFTFACVGAATLWMAHSVMVGAKVAAAAAAVAQKEVAAPAAGATAAAAPAVTKLKRSSSDGGSSGGIPVTPPSTPPHLTTATRKPSGSPPSPTEIVTAAVTTPEKAQSVEAAAAQQPASPKLSAFRPPAHHTGAIHLIMGPMFSGKTRELKRRIDVKRIASARKELKCVLIKYRKDTRYAAEGVMVTHNLIKDFDCVGVDSLSECAEHVRDAQYVFVDEGQFFGGLASYCVEWARQGREVTVAALDAYASQDLWPEIAKLIPWCVSLQKLNAVCGSCGSDASLTITNAGRPSKTSEKKIGGKDLYDASCIFCCDRGGANSPLPPAAAAAASTAPATSAAAATAVVAAAAVTASAAIMAAGAGAGAGAADRDDQKTAEAAVVAAH